MLLKSENGVTKALAQIADEREKAAQAAAKPGARAAAFASVSKRFVDDINALTTALNQTTAHFVRCMKPNSKFKKLDFDEGMIMTQLKCNGTLEAVQLMRHGYPNRVPYDLMFDRYKKHLISVPGVAELSPAQFCEVLAAIAELGPEDYQLGVSKMFLKAGKGKFLEDMKDKPVDEILPVLKAKLVEWERRKRALPMVAKYLHMQVKRSAFLRTRRLVVRCQARRRGVLARREFEVKLAAYRAANRGRKAGAAGSSPEAAAAAMATEAAIEYAEVQAEVAKEMGLDDKAAESAATAVRLGGAGQPSLMTARGSGGKYGLMSAEESEKLGESAVALPELLTPSQLQELLQGQDYHMMETEIEAIVLKAKTEARLRERQRIREITEQVRLEAQRKLKYHVSLAQKQIREELNQRVKDEVKSHATVQKATYDVDAGGEGGVVRVVQQNSGQETFSKPLTASQVEAYRSMFAQWDVDGDGSISYSEFTSVMKSIAERQSKPFSEKRVQAMFALADLDKNGSVDFPEFLVMQAQKAERGKLKAQLDRPSNTREALESLKSRIDNLAPKGVGAKKMGLKKGRGGGSGGLSDADEDGSSIAGDSSLLDDASSVSGLSSTSEARSATYNELHRIAKQASESDHEANAPLTTPVDLGPHFLREYLRFNRHGDGRLELEQFVAVMEATLLRRNLRVYRKQLEGMFKAADFDEDGVVDLRQFVVLDSVKKYFDTLQKREIQSQQSRQQQHQAERQAAERQKAAAERAALAAAQAQAAAAEAQQAVASASMMRLQPPSDPSCDSLDSHRWNQMMSHRGGVPSAGGADIGGGVFPLGYPQPPQPQPQHGGMMVPHTPGGSPGDSALQDRLERVERDLQLALQMGGSPGSNRQPKQSSVIYLDDWQLGKSGLSNQGRQRAMQQAMAGGGRRLQPSRGGGSARPARHNSPGAAARI